MEAEVLFDYAKSQDDELDLKVGDIITDVQQVDEGWCEGYKNGVKGMFPDNFVKLIQPVQQPPPVQRAQPDPPLPIRDTAVNKKKRAKVTFSYTADNEDELSLEPGQIVEVIDEEEEGWWRGLSNGKEGLFPSNFVDLIIAEEPVAEQPPPPAPKPEKTRPPSMIAIPGLGGVNPLDLKNKLKPVSGAGSKSSVPPPDTSSHHPVPPPSFERSRSNTGSNTGSKMAPRSIPKGKVMFSYTATQEDEISVNEGDIVEIVDKDTDQDGWWMIRKDGNKGLVPDNFLEALPVEKPPVSEPRADNPPLPPKKVEAPRPSGVPPPGSRPVLPKLPEKHDPVEPPPPAVKPEPNKDDLEVPHNGVLDSHLVKQRPKKIPSRPPSKSNVSEETTDTKTPEEDDKKPIKAPFSSPTPPAPSNTPSKAPGTRPKPSKATKPPPTLNKPPPASSSISGSRSGSFSSKSASVGALSQVEKPPPLKSHEPKAPPTIVETQPPSVSNDEWKEAFKQLQEDFNKFKEELKEDMRILVQDLDDERKKNAQLLIDVDRLKKTAGFREKL